MMPKTGQILTSNPYGFYVYVYSVTTICWIHGASCATYDCSPKTWLVRMTSGSRFILHPAQRHGSQIEISECAFDDIVSYGDQTRGGYHSLIICMNHVRVSAALVWPIGHAMWCVSLIYPPLTDTHTQFSSAYHFAKLISCYWHLSANWSRVQSGAILPKWIDQFITILFHTHHWVCWASISCRVVLTNGIGNQIRTAAELDNICGCDIIIHRWSVVLVSNCLFKQFAMQPVTIVGVCACVYGASLYGGRLHCSLVTFKMHQQSEE